MKMLMVTWILICFAATAFTELRPPVILREPPYDVYYKVGETVQLPCEANGEPLPEYHWKRNEIEFKPSGDDTRVVQLAGVGTLVINSPEDKDEGIFQCYVTNSFGTAFSKIVHLRQAKLDEFTFAPPITFTPKLGEPLTLPCGLPESVPPASVFWINKPDNGEIVPISYSSRVSMDREYRLRFTNIKAEDLMGGMPYACMAKNNFLRTSTIGPLYYIKPTGITEVFSNVKYMWADWDEIFGFLGETLSIRCIFSGNPTPIVRWQRTDNNLLPDRAKFESFYQELQITDLQFEDSGSYQCFAFNGLSATRLYRNFTVKVKSAPYFIEEPKNIEISAGSNVEFTCMAGGVPDPYLSWFINGIGLRDVTDPRITGPRFKHPSENTIVLENVQRTDHMVIQCNASNQFGYVFANVYLNVLSEAPTILTPPEVKKTVAEETNVNLTCRTTGTPNPIITWYKDGNQTTDSRYTIATNGDLQIMSVVLADAGLFRCEARNVYGIAEAVGTLVVRHKTRIDQAPLDLETRAGTDAKFTCSGTTDPEEVQNFKIIWLKDGKEITTNDQRITVNNQDNSLTIKGTNPWDSGTYTCIATNGLDSDRASAVLTVTF